MKHFLLLAGLLLFANSGIVKAQTVDEIIEQNIKALGGLEKINSIKNVAIEMNVETMGMQVKVNSWRERPNRHRTETDLQGKKSIQFFNGTEGWALNPFTGRETLEKMDADAARSMKFEADFDGPLVDYKNKGYTITREEDDDVEGAACWHLLLTTPEKDMYHMYIDKESGHLLKQKGKHRTGEGVELESEVSFTNYKDAMGMIMPHVMQQKSTFMGQSYVTSIKVSKVETNISMPATLFEKQ